MSNRRYIVTGGGGFVGKALCRSLRNDDHKVLSISRGVYPELAALGVESAQVDLGDDVTSWAHHFKGCDGVFHTAAKVDMWGKPADFLRANVSATRNVIAACTGAGVRSLVFTSSPSVVHTGKDLLGVDESQPYPTHFEALYPKTKAAAEQEVLKADSAGGLRTVSLRPHLIWGPGDTNLIPTILERAKKGKLVRIGDGKNTVDLTFIDDCVRAHRLAMTALENDPGRVGGKAYFISQGDPVPLWGWIDRVLGANGLPRVSKSVSLKNALIAARILESFARLLLLVGIDRQPILTQFLVTEMATSHCFNISNSERDFGYKPGVSIDEAMAQTFGTPA